MANNFGVKKDGSTRNYIGGELIYFNNRQVKQIYAKKNNTQKMVWQYDITAPTLSYWPTNNPYWSYDNVTVTASASDSESGLKSLTIGGWNTTSRTYTPTTSKQSIAIVATDNAGNSNTQYAYIQSPSVPSGFSLTSQGRIVGNGDTSCDTGVVGGSATSISINSDRSGGSAFQHPATQEAWATMRIQQGKTQVSATWHFTATCESGVPNIWARDYPFTIKIYDCWGNYTTTLASKDSTQTSTTSNPICNHTLTANISAYNSGLYFVRVEVMNRAAGAQWCNTWGSLSVSMW